MALSKSSEETRGTLFDPLLDQHSLLLEVLKPLEAEKVIAYERLDTSRTNPEVQARLCALQSGDYKRPYPFTLRQEAAHDLFDLPILPTTTIGSFPQTAEIRKVRQEFKKGLISQEIYENEMKKAIRDCVEFQESIDLDVLVHGEFERNDMVEYFGEQLSGFAFSANGWVQSYDSRCAIT